MRYRAVAARSPRTMTAHAALIRRATLSEALRSVTWSGFSGVAPALLMGIADLVTDAVNCADDCFGDFAAQMVDVGIDHAWLVRDMEVRGQEFVPGKDPGGFRGKGRQ